MKGETIPVIVLAEHEHYNLDDLQRCPCGSSLFRLITEKDDVTMIPKYEDQKLVGGEVWLDIIDTQEVCAVCGSRYGGSIDGIGHKTTIKFKDLKFKKTTDNDHVKKDGDGNVRTD